MNCQKCSEVCSCPMEPPPTESIPDPTAEPPAVEQSSADNPPCDRDPDAWRNELSDRLHRYRARRKIVPPRYPSLTLPFDNYPPKGPSFEAPSFSGFESVSNHALAVQESAPAPPWVELPQPDPPPAPLIPPAPTAKIIEFPRFAWAPPPPPLDQLAEPVCEKPRILDVPEVEPPAPALGGITIEPLQVEEPEKRPGIDIPLQSAPLVRRLFASFIDGVIVCSASALFAYIFWRVAGVRPPQLQTITLALGIPCLFWAVYQYLLMVYSSTTPGLRAAGLQLARFDGTPTTRSTRRWRILASYLSAASLGMGYAWLFLDEDALCWHDRITHTYLAPRKNPKLSE
jgi:uncharacterized RDD family membrane protein YckC